MQDAAASRAQANRLAFERLTKSEPTLIDVRPAGEVVPGFTPTTILTSGPPTPWPDYVGGQREAIIGAALFENLGARPGTKSLPSSTPARSRSAPAMISAASARWPVSIPRRCRYSSSRTRAFGNVAYCNIYEGSNPRRLNYGVYDEGVRERLLLIQNEIIPVIAEALREAGRIPLKPIIKRALGMGDELHSRNTAAALLFLRELTPAFLKLAASGSERVTTPSRP